MALQENQVALTNGKSLADLERVLRLQPILTMLQSLSADRPLISQLLPIWESLYQHIHKECDNEILFRADLDAKLVERFYKCYHKAFSAAYVLDPVYWTCNEGNTGYVPDGQDQGAGELS